MNWKIGIDVGGTFIDFFLARLGEGPLIHKILSTPYDPSIAGRGRAASVLMLARRL